MTGSESEPRDLPGENHGYRWVALTIAVLGGLVGVLNESTLIVALPTIMTDLQANLLEVTWVLIVYLLLITILAPVWGKLADPLFNIVPLSDDLCECRVPPRSPLTTDARAPFPGISRRGCIRSP